MVTTIECENCGLENRVELGDLSIAVCSSCKGKLLEDCIPASITNLETTKIFEDMPQSVNGEEVDVSKWTAIIGNPEEQAKYVKTGFWSKVKRNAAKVKFAREAVAMYYCATDRSTSITAKATAIGALAYWILPLDLIPDFVPVVGFADDATAILIAYRTIYPHIKDEHHEKAEQFFGLSQSSTVDS